MVAARRRRTSRHDALHISGAGETHLGHVRMENQDVILVEPQLGLYAVLDGMGGHPAGDVAARVGGHAIAISVRQSGRMRRRWPRQVLERALRTAASEVFRAGEERPEYHYMGTTVVACLVAPTRAVIGHVGDSRAYLLRDGELAALTRDHSVVQELLDKGEITPRKAKRHPERQRLTANLGRGGWVLPEMTELRLREGDRLLLCSDGLHGYAPASAIRRVLAERDTPGSDVETQDLELVRGKGPQLAAGRGVPEMERPITAAADDHRAIRRRRGVDQDLSLTSSSRARHAARLALTG